MKRLILSLLFLITFATILSAQNSIIPIVELKNKNLLGGVQNGKWITPAETRKILKKNAKFKFIAANNVRKGAVTGNIGISEDVCPEVYNLEFSAKADSGFAIGIAANWNPLPRIRKIIALDNAAHKKIVADFLKTKGIAETTIKITQAYQIDLDGDGKDEKVISATFYKKGLYEVGQKNDYSLVVVQKINGKTPQTLLLIGEFITTDKYEDTQTEYDIAAIADLNGDGKLEIVVGGEYYEGRLVEVFELSGSRIVQVKTLSIECYV